MSELAPGLLVAAPPLGDPNFDRSVVLLAAHGPDGAFGWIVNGEELMTIAELLMRADVTEQAIEMPGSVRIGGPVSKEQIWLVYRTTDRFPGLDGQFEVGPGVTASASRRVLEAMASGVAPAQVFALAGYAGWAPQQLEAEIRAGAWLPTDVDSQLIFDVPRDAVWQEAYARIGATPMAFTSRTVGSA
ncbi:MAG: YqgE/AlgH family protein [Polyangiaceae bacterium]|nr:YqgE/AlgH family protein [Polyangiaceae bacterium]